MKSVCVFCGHKTGKGSVFLKLAQSIGRAIASADSRLIYGGASVGMMGAIANEVLAANKEVIGVMPHVINDLELAHTGLTELIRVPDMHERKKKMYELADVFLVLPGGFGTLDELFEALTWTQLGIHKKPIWVYNFNGFYKHLENHIEAMLSSDFITPLDFELLEFVDSPEQIIKKLNSN